MKYLFTFFILSLVVINLKTQPAFWDELVTGVTVQLNSVSNINAVNAYACGNSGTVIKTTNNGYNWINVSGGGIPAAVNLVNIYAINPSEVLVAGYQGTSTFVYRTSNGGANWIQVFTQSNGFINAVWLFNTTSGFMTGDAVGGRWQLWRTTNGGINWDSSGLYLPRSGSELGWNNSLWATASGMKLWFGTNNSRIYYSSNFGTNWNILSTGSEVNSYVISVDTTGIGRGLGGSSANLLSSTNSGINWTALSVPGSGNILGVYASGLSFPQSKYVRSNSIYTSSNGFTWFVEFTASSGTYTHLSRNRTGFSTGPGVFYATKTNGGITRGNVIVEGVTIISTEIPQDFFLSQNYPNPFNSSTRIRFNVPMAKPVNSWDVRGPFVSLKVYDVRASEVANLHHKIIQPGIYESDFDASGLPSGVYFYRLVISDPLYGNVYYAHTKKMVLVR
ncbi:MAG: hypothetical protein N2510_04755 [Ignavibacteria bacterium]|nr:hypothetical protein [Ignavibacteria bacterium]